MTDAHRIFITNLRGVRREDQRGRHISENRQNESTAHGCGVCSKNRQEPGDTGR